MSRGDPDGEAPRPPDPSTAPSHGAHLEEALAPGAYQGLHFLWSCPSKLPGLPSCSDHPRPWLPAAPAVWESDGPASITPTLEGVFPAPGRVTTLPWSSLQPSMPLPTGTHRRACQQHSLPWPQGGLPEPHEGGGKSSRQTPRWQQLRLTRHHLPRTSPCILPAVLLTQLLPPGPGLS